MTQVPQTGPISGRRAPVAVLVAALVVPLLACGCASGSGSGGPKVAAPTTNAKPAAASTPKASINGYKRQVKDGEELYCREDEVLGSRVKGRLICYTAIELAERQQAADELLRQARGAVGETVTPRMDAPRF